MRGTTNMRNVRESGSVLPLNEYNFQITDKKDKTSSNGDPMVNITLTVIDGEYKGDVVYDNILIPAPDSPAARILGRTKHFLHCINEEYEGEEVIWDSDNWLGKTIKAMIAHEEPNQYHRNKRAVISEYMLDEEGLAQKAMQNEGVPSPF